LVEMKKNFDYRIWENLKFKMLLITKDIIGFIILQPQSKNNGKFIKIISTPEHQIMNKNYFA